MHNFLPIDIEIDDDDDDDDDDDETRESMGVMKHNDLPGQALHAPCALCH